LSTAQLAFASDQPVAILPLPTGAIYTVAAFLARRCGLVRSGCSARLSLHSPLHPLP
jgi:hypothetical protein